MDFAFCTKTTFAAAASSIPFFYLFSVSDFSSSVHQKFLEKKSKFNSNLNTSYFWNNTSSSSSSSEPQDVNKMLSRSSGINRLAFARVGAFCIPASGKKSATGEDGFFIASNGRSLGVADGVGGWAEQGVDPSIFTRNFMRYALDETTKPESIAQNNEYCSAIGIMQKAFNRVMKDKLLGSCAAIFCTLEDKSPVMNQIIANGDDSAEVQTRKQKRRMVDVPTGPFGTLNVANVGDCGIAIIRGGMGVVFNSREQQRSFNFPYQLGPEGDTPASALMCDYTVAAGDIVILGSDGLFDNVYPDMLPNVIFSEWRKMMPKGASNDLAISDLPPIDCESVAQQVAKMAYQSGKDRQHLSPFSLRARMGGLEYQGGKPDDITVVVGQILDTGATTTPSAEENKSTTGKTYKLEIPEYQLIEQFFQKYPLSTVQSKL